MKGEHRLEACREHQQANQRKDGDDLADAEGERQRAPDGHSCHGDTWANRPSLANRGPQGRELYVVWLTKRPGFGLWHTP